MSTANNQPEKASVAPEATQTVREYFKQTLGHDMQQENPCPMDSVCGRASKKTIDAAARLIKEVKLAFGSESAEEISIASIAESVCSCIYFG